MVNKLIILKRDVKYPRIELKTGNLVLILPKTRSISPEAIIKRHQKWIERKQKLIREIEEEYKDKRWIEREDEEFYMLVEKFVKEAEMKLKVKPRKIQFKLMKTKWGSYTKKGTINLNILMKFLSPRLIKYVIFHEMTHSLFPKHSKTFWCMIKKEFPDYPKYEKALLGYWFLINEEAKQKVKESIEK